MCNYYVGNAKVVQNANQFHIGGVLKVGNINGAHHCKSCMQFTNGHHNLGSNYNFDFKCLGL